MTPLQNNKFERKAGQYILYYIGLGTYLFEDEKQQQQKYLQQLCFESG